MANASSRKFPGFSPFEPATRTPGPMGHNDSCSPDTSWWFLGDTPGPSGQNDYGDPGIRQRGETAALPEPNHEKRLKVLAPASEAGAKLTDDDFKAAAASLGKEVTPAIIRAFAEVESGGKSGFGPNGLPVIAYEGHVFRRYTKRKYDDLYPLLSYKYVKKAGPEWRRNNRDQTVAWQTLDAAMKLDFSAALLSCSWGMFQVMGFNYKSCGYADVEGFVSAMKAGERGQLEAFAGFCKSSRELTAAIVNKDFRSMARLYNGNDYGDYDKRIEKASKKHSGK